MKALLLVMLLIGWTVTSGNAGIIKKALSDATDPGRQLIANADLEAVEGSGFTGWRGWNLGYEVDNTVARSGRKSARCHNPTAQESRGITYVLELDQTEPVPIVVECWSKAQDVAGGQDANYSLYLDLEYMDGTPLWGQIAPFRTGTHDWERRAVTVLPTKPVRSVLIHGLFRGRSGTVWFDDFAAWELRPEAGVAQFDMVPVVADKGPRIPADQRFRVFVRDVVARSDFIEPKLSQEGSRLSGEIEQLGLRLTLELSSLDRGQRVDGAVEDLTGKDRAVTVYISQDVDPLGARWFDDQRVSKPIGESGMYANWTRVGAGANGMASRLPLACIAREGEALALAAPLDVPRLWRFAYDADSRELYGAVDLGIAPDTERFPSKATFSLVMYECDPQWGFRSALQRYYELFPHCFTKRNAKEGIWMPFTDIATVEGWEDFGFQFQEGAPNPAFDEQHGIYSFPYVEPMSHWIAMPREMERTNERAIRYIHERAAAGDAQSQATLTSALEDADGQWQGGIVVAPWCDGALYQLNPSPNVPAAEGQPTKFSYEWANLMAAFGAARAKQAEMDGIYIDSLEMNATGRNYRREHFRTTATPLVYDDQGRLCQLGIFNTVESTAEAARRMWAEGKMMFANATPLTFPWGAAWLDVMGVETDWGPGDTYRPDSRGEMDYRRAICYQRPYLLLLNTVYDDFKPEWVELYMKRCAAWAIFPSMFSHNAADDPYWQRPRLYNRDRPLFKKYIPVISALSAAGWEPVTYATSDTPQVYVERFGKPGGELYLTVFNDSDAEQTVTVTLDAARLGLAGMKVQLTDLFSGESRMSDATIGLTLSPQDVMVFRLGQ